MLFYSGRCDANNQQCDLLFNKVETEEDSRGEKTFIPSFMGPKTMNSVVVHVECEQNQKEKNVFRSFHRNSLRLCCLRECFYSLPLSRVFFVVIYFACTKGTQLLYVIFGVCLRQLLPGFFSFFLCLVSFRCKDFHFQREHILHEKKDRE